MILCNYGYDIWQMIAPLLKTIRLDIITMSLPLGVSMNVHTDCEHILCKLDFT